MATVIRDITAKVPAIPADALRSELETATAAWPGDWYISTVRGFWPSHPDRATHPADVGGEDYDGTGCDWTTLADAMPETRAWVESLGWGVERVLLWRLVPGDSIRRHSDACDDNVGTHDGGKIRLHVPVCTNPGAVNTVWAGEVADHVRMAAGRCYYLDMREDHASDNAGDTARVHLVLDVIADASVRAVVGQDAA